MKQFIQAAAIALAICGCTEYQQEALPPEQRAIERARTEKYVAYKGTYNDIQRTTLFNEANQEMVAGINRIGALAKDWVGKVEKVTTTHRGTARVTIRSPHNCLYSNSDDIAVGSALYDQISTLSIGQQVAFSGTLLPHDNGRYEWSLTERGSLEEPEFRVAFTAIAPFSRKGSAEPRTPDPASGDRDFHHLTDEAHRLLERGDADAAARVFGDAQKIGSLASEDRNSYGEILLGRAASLAAAGNNEQAIAEYDTVIQAVPAGALHETAAQAITAIKEQQQAADQRRGEEERVSQVNEAIREAERISKDKGLCDTPRAIADAWGKLKNAKRGDVNFRDAGKAADRLEKCRAANMRALDKVHLQIRAKERRNVREKIDAIFLESGIDVKVGVSGPNDTHLTLTNVLFGNRPTVHTLTKDGSFLENLRKAGFKRVTFEDGFGKGLYWDLQPDDESGAGVQILDGLGLGQPLALKGKRDVGP